MKRLAHRLAGVFATAKPLFTDTTTLPKRTVSHDTKVLIYKLYPISEITLQKHYCNYALFIPLPTLSA